MGSDTCNWRHGDEWDEYCLQIYNKDVVGGNWSTTEAH